MKALQYKFSIPNYLKVRTADTLPIRTLERGNIPGLSEIDPTSSPLPGTDWVRIKPELSGICGSDISMVLNRSSPALMPFISFPLVPGHEVTGTVLEAGWESGCSAGQRVVVMPLIDCHMRGVEPCPSCQRNEPGLCTNTTEGSLSAGMLVGFCKDIPGGWSTEMVVHKSQVYAIPDEIADRTAVLIEPFSVALHAVLRNPPPDDAKVLIIGSGTIGLLVLAALRLLGNKCDVTVLARHKRQIELAEQFGATRVLKSKTAGDAAVDVVGAKKFRLIMGGHSYAGGFDWIYDCVGSKKSVDESLRVAGPRGQVIMVGCAAEISKIDMSYLWARELTVTGCYVYGRESSMPGAPHSFDVAIDLLKRNPEFGLGAMVTHVIPLSDWHNAFKTVLDRKGSGAIKVAFDCQS